MSEPRARRVDQHRRAFSFEQPSPITYTRTRTMDQAIKMGVLLGLPLFASLVVLLLGWTSRSVLNGLIFLLFGCATLYFARSLGPLMRERRLGQLLFLVGFMGWYALPALLNALDGERAFGDLLPAMIDPKTVIVSVALLSLFLLSWAVAFAFLSRRDEPSPAVTGKPQEVSRKRLYLILVGAVLVGLLPYLVSGLRPTELLTTIGEARAVDKPWSYNENLGNQTSALLYLASSVLAAAACLLWSSLLDKRLPVLTRILFGAVAGVLTLLIYFDQGTRSVTVLVLLPTLLMLFVRLYRRSRASFVLAVVLAAVVLLGLLQFQLLFRTNYTRDQVNDLLLNDWVTLGGTSDYFTETLLAVHIVPQYHDFFRESALLQFVISPIPRFIWENKPVTQVAWFYSLIRWGIDIYTESGNVFPGIVGQYYMSWGWLGAVMIGVIMAWVAAKADRILIHSDIASMPYNFLLGAMLATWVLITFRFLSPGFLYPVLIVAVMLWIATVPINPTSLRTKYE